MFRRNWHPPCTWAGGLPGFIGPFPSTSLDESRFCYTCLVVYVLCTKLHRLYILYVRRGSLSILLKPLRARFPRVQVLVLLRGKRVKAHTHSMELEASNLFVYRGRNSVD